jgi:hydrogenase maturation protease
VAKILVAGIGNIFLGDDGFGPEVVRRVSGETGWDDSGVHVVDYGIRGLHLAYDLLDGWDALVLVDAVPECGRPGEVHVFEADPSAAATPTGLDAHRMDPAEVFASLRALGGTAPRTIVVGCQVATVEERIGLSAPVDAAIADAVRAVRDVIVALEGTRCA